MDDQDSMQKNQMMMMKDSANTMMMNEMQKHMTAVYAFDILVLIGLVILIVLLSKVLKELRKK